MVPYEIVSVIIKYFRGYENDEKRKLKLSQKEENICNIIVKNYCDIIQDQYKYNKKNEDNKHMQSKVLVENLLKGITEEINIDIYPKFKFSYEITDIELIDKIDIHMNEIYRFITKIIDTTNKGYIEEYMYDILSKTNIVFDIFVKIIGKKTNIHCLLCEKRIYLRLIDL